MRLKLADIHLVILIELFVVDYVYFSMAIFFSGWTPMIDRYRKQLTAEADLAKGRRFRFPRNVSFYKSKKRESAKFNISSGCVVRPNVFLLYSKQRYFQNESLYNRRDLIWYRLPLLIQCSYDVTVGQNN